MASRHSICTRLALLCFWALATSAPTRAHADDGTAAVNQSTPSATAPTTTATKKKKRVAEATVEPGSPTEQFTAPLQMNLDAVKALILKPDPVVPYLPQPNAVKPAAPPAKGDTSDQPHLAPLLRETSLPDSAGDRGSFMERHEFGIQLHDHF